MHKTKPIRLSLLYKKSERLSTKYYEVVGIRTQSGYSYIILLSLKRQSATSAPHETTIDNIISFIVFSPLILIHDKVKLIIEIKIEIDIERPKE